MPEYMSSIKGKTLLVLNMTSMSIVVLLTLEMDVASVAICSRKFYQRLLGFMMWAGIPTGNNRKL